MTLSGKTVLVTGADGFLGSWLVEKLIDCGARVTALAYYNSFNDWGWLEAVPCLKDVHVAAGDVRDPNFCRSLAKGVDIVFHLAALIPIPYSYIAPDSFIDTNVRGTLNLCQAARDAGVSKFIHTSTSEVYGSARYVPMDEGHPLTPQSPYSASKIGADSIALSFWYSFDLPVVVARPFNSFGPRQSARAVIPTIISQIASGMRRIRLGNLTTTRDFTYAEDTCRGFLAIAQHDGGVGEVYHIGSGREISVGELAGKIAGMMNSGPEIIPEAERIRPEASEVMRLCCDNRKLFEATGFRPCVPLEQGLARTVAWFQDPANLRRYKGHIYNV